MFNSKRIKRLEDEGSGNIVFLVAAIFIGTGIFWCQEKCTRPYEVRKQECIKLCGHERLVEDRFSEHECVCFTDREVVPR